MVLFYKDDWDAAKARYRAWWDGEYIGRCGLFVTAPREGIDPNEPAPAPPTDFKARWTDLDYISASNEYRNRRTFFGAEGFPCWHPGYPGHLTMPAFLGCRVRFDERTAWWEPFLAEDEWRLGEINLHTHGRWWRYALEALDRQVTESMGKCIPSIGDLGWCGDTLAGIRGSDRLLVDLLERPALVRATEEHLMSMWCEVYDEFYRTLAPAGDSGSTCWFPLWAPGKFFAVQNDFSYMISPGMFREIFLPVLRRQTDYLDYSVYHVDGVNAFAHVPALCELPKLQAIQILPGSGKPSPLHYPEALKAVQAAGKNLHITISRNEVEPALATLSAKGLFIHTSCPTEAEARELMTKVRRWSVAERN